MRTVNVIIESAGAAADEIDSRARDAIADQFRGRRREGLFVVGHVVSPTKRIITIHVDVDELEKELASKPIPAIG